MYLSNVFAALAAGLTFCSAQCLNEVAIFNPNSRTLTLNATYFLIPIPKAALQNAIDKQYGPGRIILGPVPVNDKTLFPGGGFDNTKYHPIFTQHGFASDTRMAVLQIQGNYLQGSITVPYVRRFDSAPDTVLQVHLTGFIAGENNEEVPGLIPSVVATFANGISTALGQFLPFGAAWQIDPNRILSTNAAWKVVPNPVSGPGVLINAFQQIWTNSQDALTKVYTPKLWKAMLNQPIILTSELFAFQLCQRNQYYFNNKTSTMYGAIGNVTLGDGADYSLINGSLTGFYPRLAGFSACAQSVGYLPVQQCDEAYKSIDKSAL